jgi:hypothetical protein
MLLFYENSRVTTKEPSPRPLGSGILKILSPP